MTKPLGLIKVIFNLLTLLVASVAPKVVLPFGIQSEIGLEFISFLTKGSSQSIVELEMALALLVEKLAAIIEVCSSNIGPEIH